MRSRRGEKKVGRVSRNNTKARESILEEDLAKNVSLSLHNSFCLFEPRVEGEEFAQSSEEIAGAKGMDAVLSTAESLGRDRD